MTYTRTILSGCPIDYPTLPRDLHWTSFGWSRYVLPPLHCLGELLSHVKPRALTSPRCKAGFSGEIVPSTASWACLLDSLEERGCFNPFDCVMLHESIAARSHRSSHSIGRGPLHLAPPLPRWHPTSVASASRSAALRTPGAPASATDVPAMLATWS